MSPPRRRYARLWRNITAEVDDELRFHLESRIREYRDAGMSEDDARAAALARFGDVDRVRETCETIDHLSDRERRRTRMWDTLRQDVIHALRAFRRTPGFTLVAILTLALGIGANTAIFSVVNGVLLRPLPYTEPDRLVRLYTAFHGSGELRYGMSQPEFMDYKGLTHIFENAAAFTGTRVTLTGDDEPRHVRGIAATRDLLPVLGVTPFLGRNFEGDEGRSGTEPVVIVAHEFWQTHFGGDPSLLDRTIQLNGIGRRVIGILPPQAALADAELFTPLFIHPDSLTHRTFNYLNGVARLRPGVTLAHAQRELNALTARSVQAWPSDYPADMGYGATVAGMHEEIVGDIRPALLVLLGAVGLVLLIACANVANLLLARGEVRQREIAVRMAIGAGRGRVLRQLLTESMLLAGAGAVVGMLLAWWGLRTIIALSPESIPRVEEVRIDVVVGFVALGATLLTGVLFGLFPALQLMRTDVQTALKDGGRTGSGAGTRSSLGRLLVVGEIALAVVVVIGATLLVRSYGALRNVDAGFAPAQRLVVDLSLPGTRYDGQTTVTFYRQLVDQLRGLPGVESAAAASDLPPVAGGNNWDIEIDGRPVPEGQSAPSPNIRSVTHDYFATLAIGVLQGRVFTTEDNEGSLPVAVINETAARRIWPGEDPVGKRVRFGARRPWVTIVGVARDVRSAGLAEAPSSELFLLHGQMLGIATPERAMYLVVRTSGEPMALVDRVRATIRETDPMLAIGTIRTLDDIVTRSVARQRFTATLLTAFGVVALVLAAVGIYGIMSYGVRLRTREIGIRMALGAQSRDVLALFVGQGMRLAAMGLAAGVLAAFALARLMTRLLFGVAPSDPVTYVSIVLLLAAVALLATWIPARRAVRVDPMRALRAE